MLQKVASNELAGEPLFECSVKSGYDMIDKHRRGHLLSSCSSKFLTSELNAERGFKLSRRMKLAKEVLMLLRQFGVCAGNIRAPSLLCPFLPNSFRACRSMCVLLENAWRIIRLLHTALVHVLWVAFDETYWWPTWGIVSGVRDDDSDSDSEGLTGVDGDKASGAWMPGLATVGVRGLRTLPGTGAS